MTLDVSSASARAHQAMRGGNVAEAEQLCRAILAQERENVDASLLLGVISARRGDAVAAIAHLRQAVEGDPDSWDALNWLCRLLRQTGAVGEAIDVGRKACDVRPGSAEGWSNLGNAYLSAWAFADALSCFDRAAAAEPGLAPAQHNRGVALQRLGRAGEAEAAYRKAIELDRNAPQSLVSLAGLLLARGDRDEVDRCLDQAATRVGGNPAGLRALALALREQGFFDRAEATLKALLGAPGAGAGDLVQLAQVEQQLGRFDVAVSAFERIVQAAPTLVRPYFDLTQSRRMTPDDSTLLERMLELRRDSALTPIDRILVNYALGKSYDDLGEYERAFSFFHEANTVQLSFLEGRRLDQAGLSAAVDKLIATFTLDYFDALPAGRVESDLPVLIVGMIRSGTTLVEQILSSHPAVGAAGEQHFLYDNASILSPSAQDFLSRGSAVAEAYINLLRSLAPGKSRVTEKLPTNYFVLGFVHALLPNARIIHCRRNPADTCLSIYVTPFGEPLDFGHDPASIAFFYRQYLRLAEHWRAVLPADRFLEVDYEDVVADREAVARKMVAHCGLEWNDACLRHEQRGGAVVTPSTWQVRQPIYKRSVGRWEHYRRFLPEFGSLPG
ncbi:MAG TPA: sulfotransferase [Fimbriimonadaceae bacterium]|nr:sulfotransferase [Fimbriimonadaceae bacterium]